MNYQTVVSWDANLIDVWFLDADTAPLALQGLAREGVYTVTGSPATPSGRWMPSAKVYNTVDKTWYIMTGSSASPAWSLIDSGAGFTLPASITDSSTTTGTSFNLVMSAVTTGVGQKLTLAALTTGTGLEVIGNTANFTTGGALFAANMVAAIAGNAFTATTTGVYTGTGLLVLTANAATTGTLASISGSGLTTGTMMLLTGGGANMGSSGKMIDLEMGAATNGTALKISTSGVYTGNGLRFLQAGSATTAVLDLISATALTTGIAQKVILGATSLTTGRYVSYNDGAGEVFGVGTNGHLISTVSASVPTISVTQQNGITNAAITAGGSDTAGIITTTGTNNNGGTTVLEVTFGKTYTTAPKAVILTPKNASAAKIATTSLLGVYVSATSATTFDITIPADAAAGATPSWSYLVIA